MIIVSSNSVGRQTFITVLRGEMRCRVLLDHSPSGNFGDISEKNGKIASVRRVSATEKLGVSEGISSVIAVR